MVIALLTHIPSQPILLVLPAPLYRRPNIHPFVIPYRSAVMPSCDLYHKNGEDPARRVFSGEVPTIRDITARPGSPRAPPAPCFDWRARPSLRLFCGTSKIVASPDSSGSALATAQSPVVASGCQCVRERFVCPYNNQPGKGRTQQTKVSPRFFSRPNLSKPLLPGTMRNTHNGPFLVHRCTAGGFVSAQLALVLDRPSMAHQGRDRGEDVEDNRVGGPDARERQLQQGTAPERGHNHSRSMELERRERLPQGQAPGLPGRSSASPSSARCTRAGRLCEQKTAPTRMDLSAFAPPRPAPAPVTIGRRHRSPSAVAFEFENKLLTICRYNERPAWLPRTRRSRTGRHSRGGRRGTLWWRRARRA